MFAWIYLRLHIHYDKNYKKHGHKQKWKSKDLQKEIKSDEITIVNRLMEVMNDYNAYCTNIAATE